MSEPGEETDRKDRFRGGRWAPRAERGARTRGRRGGSSPCLGRTARASSSTPATLHIQEDSTCHRATKPVHHRY